MIPTQDSNCIHWRYLSSTCACLYWSQFFGGEQYLSIKTNGSETGIEIGQNSLSAQALSKTCLSGDCAHTGPKPGLWVSPFTHTFIFPVQVTVCKGLYSPQDLNHRVIEVSHSGQDVAELTWKSQAIASDRELKPTSPPLAEAVNMSLCPAKARQPPRPCFSKFRVEEALVATAWAQGALTKHVKQGILKLGITGWNWECVGLEAVTCAVCAHGQPSLKTAMLPRPVCLPPHKGVLCLFWRRHPAFLMSPHLAWLPPQRAQVEL